MQKWNYEKNDYEDYAVPDDWNVRLYSDNMSEIINCAACGKEEEFGDCFISKEIHNNHGFGYSVCPDCHAEEIKRAYKSLKMWED